MSDPSPQVRRPSRIPRVITRLLRTICGVVVLILAWYVVARVLAPMHAVQVFEPEGVSYLDIEHHALDLTTVTWNIAHGRGPNVPERLSGNFQANWDGTTADKIARCRDMGRTLARWKADLVALNEIDFDAFSSGHKNQAEIMAAEAGLPYRVEQRNYDIQFPFARFKSGNALLSRWPIADAQWVRFPALKTHERFLAGNHDALLARIDLPGERTLRVLVAHFEVRDPESRRLAAQRILEIEAAEPDTPLLLLGDLNSRPNDPSNAAGILRAGKRFSGWPTTPDTASTFPALAPKPGRWIDYSLATPPLRLVSQRAETTARQSDHLPVHSVWTWP